MTGIKLERLNYLVDGNKRAKYNFDGECFVCKVCDTSFTKKSTLILHMKNHKINMEHICIFCGRDYEDERDLINHMLSHRDILEEYNKIFLKKANSLQFHIQSTSASGNELIQNTRVQIKIEHETEALKSDFISQRIKNDTKNNKEFSVDSDTFDPEYDSDSPRSIVDVITKKAIIVKPNKSKVNSQSNRRETQVIAKTTKKCIILMSQSSGLFEKDKVLSSNENVKSQFECDTCSYFTSDKNCIILHIRKHSGGWPYVCDQCDYKTKLFHLLKGHLISHKDKSIFCDICGKAFRRQFNLKEHLRSHSHMRDFHCTECPKSYKDLKPLRFHLLKKHGVEWSKKENPKILSCNRPVGVNDDQIHDDIKPYICDQCDFKTYVLHILKRHQIKHEDKGLYCEFCGKAFRRIHNLKEHIRSHSNERNFHCSKCPKSYKDSKSLKTHLLHTHMDEQIKSFKCSQCDIRAASLFSLRQHEKRHNPENAFQCDRCSYSCRAIATLKRHSLVHLNFPVFSCSHCEYKSISDRALKIHSKVHKNKSTSAV